MKRTEQSTLLNAILADEIWDLHNAQVQTEALAAVRSGKKRRTRMIISARLAAITVILATLWWTFRGALGHSNPTAVYRNTASVQRSAAKMQPAAGYVTEDQMLAMFPSGSCVVAEVNGQTRLIVLEETRTQ